MPAINRSDVEPSVGQNNILLDAFALGVAVADLKLRIGYTLLGRAQEPLGGLLGVGFHALPHGVQDAELIFGQGKILLGSLVKPTKGGG